MAGEVTKGDYVRIRDLAGNPHIGKVDFTTSKKVRVGLLCGLWASRGYDQVEKLTIGEEMLLKLESE
jgi:hypothetical protein